MTPNREIVIKALKEHIFTTLYLPPIPSADMFIEPSQALETFSVYCRCLIDILEERRGSTTNKTETKMEPK